MFRSFSPSSFMPRALYSLLRSPFFHILHPSLTAPLSLSLYPATRTVVEIATQEHEGHRHMYPTPAGIGTSTSSAFSTPTTPFCSFPFHAHFYYIFPCLIFSYYLPWQVATFSWPPPPFPPFLYSLPFIYLAFPALVIAFLCPCRRCPTTIGAPIEWDSRIWYSG